MGPLSSSDLERMDAEAIRILKTLGVMLDHDEVRARLIAAGAEETSDAKIVRLPERLVREAVESAPKTVRLSSVAGDDVDLTANGPTVFWSGNALYLTTLEGRRQMTSELLAPFIRLLDALEHVHAPVAPSVADYPPTTRNRKPGN